MALEACNLLASRLENHTQFVRIALEVNDRLFLLSLSSFEENLVNSMRLYALYICECVSVCVRQTTLTSSWTHYSYSPRPYTSHSYFCLLLPLPMLLLPPKVSSLPSKSALQIVILFRILFTSHPNTIYCQLFLFLVTVVIIVLFWLTILLSVAVWWFITVAIINFFTPGAMRHKSIY